MTLPLIYTLNNCDVKQKNFIIDVIKNHNKDAEKVATIIELVKESGGLEYAIKMMRDYHQKALTILMEFEDSETRNALKKMIDFVIERKQ
jgi:octaprenyl-diphosphate synthase